MLLAALLLWLVIALVVGLIANKLVDLHGDDPRLAIGAAAGGAVVAGILYLVFGPEGARGWDRWCLLYVTAAAAVGVTVWHLIRSRYVSRAHQTSRRSY
jgi:uncharacterized membrane protein YeaQ/YmgE (transglycosylase-associated protein family)